MTTTTMTFGFCFTAPFFQTLLEVRPGPAKTSEGESLGTGEAGFSQADIPLLPANQENQIVEKEGERVSWVRVKVNLHRPDLIHRAITSSPWCRLTFRTAHLNLGPQLELP